MRKIHRPMIFAAAAVLWLSGLVSGCGGSAGMPAAGGEISQSGTEMTEGNSATGRSSAEKVRPVTIILTWNFTGEAGMRGPKIRCMPISMRWKTGR